ncbi:hypothetical protein [Photorhabdus sp. S14-60]|uniref:hypothetical protein n=1 Tax=Photorhabdus sp. S14-60 TaxID=2029689 RepID=UPI0002E778E0|nr:hypothetical protein [Photorhabdus sp. S14-60]NDK95965.1 hypothetical protein [Photorhabdus laumondii subsp. laumondii]
MTGVSECSQQRSNLKDDGYNYMDIVSLKKHITSMWRIRLISAIFQKGGQLL